MSKSEATHVFGWVPLSIIRQLDRNGDGWIDLSDASMPSHPTSRDFLVRLGEADTNFDGFVTLNEFDARFPGAVEGSYSQLDGDGDGVLGPSDLPPAAADSRESLLRWLAMADSDGNGAVTRSELELLSATAAEKALFQALDSDQDAAVSFADLPGGPIPASKLERMQLLSRLLAADANRDGHIDYTELVPIFPEAPAELFAALDSSGDGHIDRYELSLSLGASVDPPLSPADVNADGAVDSVDIQIVVSQSIGGASHQLPADLDGNGGIDYGDVHFVTRQVLVRE